MKRVFHTSTNTETRTETIHRHVLNYIQCTGNMTTWVIDVVEDYFCHVPPEKRRVKFHSAGDALKNIRANTQILRRYFDLESTTRPMQANKTTIGAGSGD